MTTSAWGVEGYRSLGRRSAWTQVSLAVVIGVDLLTIAVELSERSRIGRDRSVTDDELADLGERLALVGTARTGAFFVCAFFFVLWFSRAYANIVPLGAREPRFGRGWAVGGWFVPVLNVWRPKQIANDVWRASDPGAPADQGEEWKGRPVPGFLLAWWLLFAFGTWLAWTTASLLPRGTAAEAERSLLAFAAADTLDVVAALFAIAVVRAVTAREEARATLLARQGLQAR
ncbi:MAG TPA: DUF4328 domain-containing protein [Gaiellaceae bacterium]|nr:DUF4328 domain-containing protein [Gaiellaceae bacterium]